MSALVQAAEAKLNAVNANQKAKLQDLIIKVRAASARGDRAETAKLDGELTNFLFEID